MGKQTFIEINGKKYDAVTGRLLSTETTNTPTPVVRITPNQGVVDGFVRRSNAVRSGVVATKKPQKSQTLARSAVKKPQPKTASKVTPTQTHQLIKKPSLQPPHHLVAKAAQVPKSPQIQKFDHREAPRTSVQRTPSTMAVVRHEQRPTAATTKPMQQPSKRASEHLIEAALAQATAHQEPTHHNHRRKSRLSKRLGVSRRVVSASAAILAGVLLVGFFAVQNVPNLSMRVASARAGFAAEMPGYMPSGFSFKGPINYRSGQVRVSFRSNTDTREYTLVQTSSNWNSDALLANFISAEKKQYQTYLDKGRTLYIYDGANATWVDNGVWYQIEGTASLTTDQLIRIASSL